MTLDLGDMQVGDTVAVQVIGKVTTVTRDRKTFNIVAGMYRQAHNFSLDTEGDALTVVIQARAKKPQPEHWPPQPGDIWRHTIGVEYVCVGDKMLTTNRPNKAEYPVADFLIHAHPQNLTLVYRAGNDPK